MNTITASEARTNLFQLIKKTVKGHVHTRITSKEGSAVMLSEEEYESLLETSELLSVPNFKQTIKKADKEIKEGKTLSFDDVFGA
ncbi:MAG: type II toxin-antitoxin system Phd/YefM family antitoxin [Bacteroidetes bacterium]|nr:type II toxin-antitoxin system Phd/YefM family antitoxin [Bacteroidota bacterium]MBU1678166.1 type II toxin-antitoxin system Phd/YefM family antitoxin [Bacteroidota bacterium]MBU2506710.1 type II toxin-antitoxin system Phd/YefM family antitoxin [Bacteroidota bacterium]